MRIRDNKRTGKSKKPISVEQARAIMDETKSADADTKSSGKSNSQKPQLTDLVIAIVHQENVELWRDKDERGYITFHSSGRFHNHHLDSPQAKRWFKAQLYTQHGRTLPDDALRSILLILEQECLQKKQYTPNIRSALFEGNIYIDLCNDQGEAVVITRDGWHVSSTLPVKFLRKDGSRPLCRPRRTQSAKPLFKLLRIFNIDEEQQILVTGWLLRAFPAMAPYLILVIIGEPGSTKSTTTEGCKLIVDPTMPLLRALPRSEEDLYVAASCHKVLAFDNVSKLEPWLSDAFCRLLTGGGFGVRKLYHQHDEALYEGAAPLIINGIEESVSRADLASRAIILDLSAIPDSKRITKREFEEKFAELLPDALGVLMNALSCALRNVDTIELARLPRMADAVKWVSAAEEALEWSPGTFLEAYERNQKHSLEIASESSPLAQVLQDLISDTHPFISGTATELLRIVRDHAPNLNMEAKFLPQTPIALSNSLKRIAPALRALGIEVHRLPRREQRIIEIRRIQDDTTGASASPTIDFAPTSPSNSSSENSLVATDAADASSGHSTGMSNCAKCVRNGDKCASCFLS